MEESMLVTALIANRERRPPGVDWDRVRADQFETIPFLASLRDRMVQRRKVS